MTPRTTSDRPSRRRRSERGESDEAATPVEQVGSLHFLIGAQGEDGLPGAGRAEHPAAARRTAVPRHTTKARRPPGETRERIVLAAAEAFAERGYAGVNLAEVVERLGLTKGAMYFYFPSKDDLVHEIVERHFAAWDEVATDVTAESDYLDAIVVASYAVAENYRTSPIARAGTRLSAERNLASIDLPEPYVGWIERVTALLRAAKRAKQLRPGLNERVIAQMLVASFYGLQSVSEHLSARTDLKQQLDAFWHAVLPSLRPA